MDGTHLNNAADVLDGLADEVDQFVNTASEEAAAVAQRVRDVATDLRNMGNAIEGTHTGTVEPTPPESAVGVETPPADAEPTAP